MPSFENEKKERLAEVLDVVCSNSPNRWYGMTETKRHQYKQAIDYILGEKSINHNKLPPRSKGYYVTEYSIDCESKDYADFKDKLDEHIIFDNIPFDFDNEDNPREAINEAIRVCQKLESDFGVEPLLNFSGSKGAHLLLCFAPIEVKHPQEVKKAFSLWMESTFKVTLDKAVYSSIKRFIRIPCSRHEKSKNYGHFLDYNDTQCINEVIDSGLCEISTKDLLESDSKYFIPKVPNLEENKKVLEPFIKHLDSLAEAETKARTNNKYNYDFGLTEYEETTEENFLSNFKKLWKDGQKNYIGYRLMHLWRRCNKPKEEVQAFFDELEPNDREVKQWINYAYSINPNNPNESRHLGGLNHFLEGVELLAPQNERENLIKYFKSVFKRKSKEELKNDEELQKRHDPSDAVDIKRAKQFEKMLISKEEENIGTSGYLGAFLEYLTDKLKDIMIGDTVYVVKTTLGCFNIMCGYDSYFIIVEGEAESGKSYELQVVIDFLIPNLYTLKLNDSTYASFTRKGDINKRCYERLILYAGDLGDKSRLEKFREIEPIIKELVTENEYIREFTSNDNKSVERVELKVESIGYAFTTANTGEELDSQTLSRAILSNSNDKMKREVNTFYTQIQYSKHPIAIKRQRAIDDLERDFKNYLLYKMNMEQEVLVGHFDLVLQELTSDSDSQVRDFQKIHNLFKAYCILTSYQCKTLDNGDLVATETQLLDFIQGACPESAMNPKAYNLLQLIKYGTSKKENQKEEVITYFKSEEITEDKVAEDEEADTIEDLIYTPTFKTLEYEIEAEKVEEMTLQERDRFINKLIRKYGIKSKYKDKEKGAVFRVTDITRLYKNYKAYNDIEDISTVLYHLYLKGYLGKLEFKDNNRQNIYYLTTKAKHLEKLQTITDLHRRDYKRWLKAIQDEVDELNLEDTRIREIV